MVWVLRCECEGWKWKYNKKLHLHLSELTASSASGWEICMILGAMLETLMSSSRVSWEKKTTQKKYKKLSRPSNWGGRADNFVSMPISRKDSLITTSWHCSLGRDISILQHHQLWWLEEAQGQQMQETQRQRRKNLIDTWKNCHECQNVHLKQFIDYRIK